MGAIRSVGIMPAPAVALENGRLIRDFQEVSPLITLIVILFVTPLLLPVAPAWSATVDDPTALPEASTTLPRAATDTDVPPTEMPGRGGTAATVPGIKPGVPPIQPGVPPIQPGVPGIRPGVPGAVPGK